MVTLFQYVHSEECQPTNPSRAERPAKIRAALLPQEYELVRLFEEVENPHPSWNVDTPANEWEAIRGSPLGTASMYYLYNREKYGNAVRKTFINGRKLRGKLNLQYLPYSVACFHAGNNYFTGGAQLDSLPPSLELLCLSANQFEGSVDLSSLPEKLQILSLERNHFSGSVCLNRLPNSLKHLNLMENAFAGTPDLQQLPSTLIYLDLSENHFHGYVILDSLPESISLHLNNNNAIHGEIEEKILPWGTHVSTMGTNVTVHRRPNHDKISKQKVRF